MTPYFFICLSFILNNYITVIFLLMMAFLCSRRRRAQNRRQDLGVKGGVRFKVGLYLP